MELRELNSRRNDLVDGEIESMISRLAPPGVKAPDIFEDEGVLELREQIANLIEDFYVSRNLCTEQEFRDFYTDEEIEAAEGKDDVLASPADPFVGSFRDKGKL